MVTGGEHVTVEETPERKVVAGEPSAAAELATPSGWTNKAREGGGRRRVRLRSRACGALRMDKESQRGRWPWGSPAPPPSSQRPPDGRRRLERKVVAGEPGTAAELAVPSGWTKKVRHFLLQSRFDGVREGCREAAELGLSPSCLLPSLVRWSLELLDLLDLPLWYVAPLTHNRHTFPQV